MEGGRKLVEELAAKTEQVCHGDNDDGVHDGDGVDGDDQVVGRLEGEGGALAARAGGGPGTNGVRLLSSK